MKTILSMTLMTLSAPLYASVGEMTMEGLVKSFDQNTVTIISHNKEITAPRKFLDIKNIRSGQAVSLRFTASDVSHLSFKKQVPTNDPGHE